MKRDKLMAYFLYGILFALILEAFLIPIWMG
jgi:hypothetical protein